MSFSLDELLKQDTNGVTFDTVKAYGGEVRIGSLNSEDMIEWLESNDDKEKQRFAGLRLIVKSVVNADGTRIPKDQQEAAIDSFKKKDARENGKVVRKILRLNGIDGARGAELVKNDSSEEAGGTSPSGSPSPQAE